ncbi:MAG: hypothetical protein P1V51_12205 [Deltaproteobacteria bacterium]|nr:hypothetical protein [Deltaproteobacteria bacterium]
MRFTTFFQATIALFAVVVLSGCPGKECEANADCGTNQTCNLDTNECEDIADLCLARTTPCQGGMTCDPATGECTGVCCTAATCPDPRTTCDETQCQAGAGTGACVQKVCTNDTTQPDGCPVDFNCNQLADPPSCEAACITDGCPEFNENCDETTGECIIRLPIAGETGSPCTVNSDCAVGAGLECFDEARYGIRGGYCTKGCNSDSECPTGSFCDGVCVDACDVNIGDCPTDQQCISSSGAPADYCFPIFDQSECTTGCRANGAPCDPDVADQCEAGSACVDFSGGAMCMSLSCHLGLDPFDATGNTVLACDAGETCQGLGIGLTGCMTDCDPADVNACQTLTNADGTATCAPSPQIESNYDAFFIAASAAGCAGTNMADSTSVNIGGTDVFICYNGCTVDADCDAGQFCDPAEVAFVSGDVATFNACMNYNVVEGNSCADTPAPCGARDCMELNLGTDVALICYEGCTADADCNAATVGGACSRLEFLTGDAMDLCLYDSAGAFCFMGCETNADCGYCQVDADCPVQTISQGVTRQERCDLATNTCVMPLSGVAEVNQYCNSGQVYWAGSINVLDAGGNPATAGGCASPCDSDLECGGGLACVANAAAAPAVGFCERGTYLCNGPTGQCEATCAAGTDCWHGTCEAGAGPMGEDRCVAGCTTDADCGPGVCDVSLGFCVATQMWNLTVDGSNTNGTNGDMVYASVRDAAGTEIASGTDTIGVGAGPFAFTWNDILPDGGDYTVDIYVDINADAACTNETDDDVFQVVLTAVAANQTVTADTTTEVAAACASF